MSDQALTASGFPASVLQPFLDEVKSFAESGVTKGTNAFRDSLNGDDNKTIRLFVAEADGIVQQASTVLVLRRLAAPNSGDLPGYGYAGTIEVAYAGGDATLDKLKNLLPELEGGTEGKVDKATVKLVAFPFTTAPDEVNLGFSGGAPEDMDYPKDLKVKFFLRLQPYRQEGKEQVMVGGDSARSVDLAEQQSLGKEKYALRAYAVPKPEVSDEAWAYYTGQSVPIDVRRNAEILRWLTESAQLDSFDLQPIDGINARRENGQITDTEMGSPAGERVVEVVAGALATQFDAKTGRTAQGAKPAILFNFAEYDPEAAKVLSFDYISGLLGGDPTESEFPFLPESQGGNAEGQGAAEVVRAFQNRSGYLKQVKAKERVTFLDQPTLAKVQQAADAIRNKTDQVLYLQLGPVPQPLESFAYSQDGLPSVFTGLGLADLALTVGNFYYSVAAPDVGGVRYPQTVLTKNDNGEVPFALQTVADQIAVGLSFWPAAEAENPAELQGTFVKDWRSGSAAAEKFKAYFAGLRDFYLKSDNDKLNLGLGFLNYVIETENLPDDALKKLYDKLKESINPETKEIDLVPGVFTQGSVIFDFFSKLLANFAGKLTMKVAELKAEPSEEDIQKILLSGTTDAFDLETGLDIVYTAPEKRIVSQNKFTGLVSWSIPNVEWIVFKDPFVRADVANAELPTVGAVGGSIAGANDNPKLTFQFDAPVEEGKWLLQGRFADPLPSITSFYQLAGGINIAASLPPPLNILVDLGLENFELLYDEKANQGKGRAEYLNFVIKTSQTLTLLPGFDGKGKISLEGLKLEFNIQNPQDVKTRKWTTTATGNFEVKPVDGKVEVSVKIPAVVFQGQLKSGTIDVVGLVESFVPLLPPDALSFLPKAEVTAFAFNYQKEKDALDVSAQLNTDFSVFDLIRLDQLSFQITRRKVENQSVSTGSVAGNTTILPGTELAFGVGVSATYGGEKLGWTFEANTTDPVPLGKMIEFYLQWPLGGFEELEIEKLSLKVEEKTGSWEFEGATNTFPTPLGLGLQASAQLGDNKDSKALGLGFIDPTVSCAPRPVQSRFLPELMLADVPPVGKFGFVAGTVTWQNITVRISYNFDPKVQKFCIEWDKVKACLETNTETIATFSLAGETVGSIVETMVSWARGGQAFSLSAPWNVLNSIPLDTFELVWNITKGTVSFKIKIGPIELGFARIDEIALSYEEDDDKKFKVMVTLVGRFLWQTDDPAKPLNWNAADPKDTPAPPGKGNKYLDLRLLAMGQHVTAPCFPTVEKVQEAIECMATLPVTDPCKIPPIVFRSDSNWIFGTDFGVLRLEAEGGEGGALVPASGALVAAAEGGGYFLTLQIVFNDPVLYGLRIALDGKPAKIFKGLDFQIMYQQISDSVGVYRAEITLPDIMRRITVGAYTVTLPVFGIAVYTNGDFQIDIGFPWNLDFSRSFTIEAIIPPGIPVLGSAGFYFGKLSSATTNKVPAATNGTFNPVIVFGFGAQLGLGKSFEAGILKAGFSLTAFGILEGVIAKWNPYLPDDVGAGGTDQVQGQYYFWLQGTFGIIGKLYGTIDFAIVKAEVNILIEVYVQLSFAPYEPIPITVAALVDVKVKVTVNLGLFKIKITLSFRMNVKATFTIVNGGTPPWQLEGDSQFTRLDERRARMTDFVRWTWPELFEVPINWTNLLPPAEKLPLLGYLGTALTMAGDEAQTPAEQLACYVATLFIESPPAASEDAETSRLKAAGLAADSSFDLLAKQVLRWAAAAVLGELTPSEVDSKPITKEQLEALLDDLSDPNDPMPIPPEAIEAFLAEQLTFTVQKPPQDNGNGEEPAPQDATYFPMATALKFDAPKYGDDYPGFSYTYADYNTAPEAYLEGIRKYFAELAVKVQEEMGGAGLDLAAAAGGISMASYVLMDYFVLLARQMVQAALDALRDYKFAVEPGQTPDEVVQWVSDNGGQVRQGEAYASFSLTDLFEGNPDHPLTGGKKLQVDGVRTQVQAGSSFDTIAAEPVWEGSFRPAQLATKNQLAAQILQPGSTVTFEGEAPHTVQPTDTLDSIATDYGVSLDVLLAKSNVLASTDLLAPMAILDLPPVFYTSAADHTDTLAGVAARFAVGLGNLANGQNGGLANLFFADSAAHSTLDLDLVHLAQLNVGPLIADAQRSLAIQHLSGMASRYYFHGLRLPTCVEEDETEVCIQPNALGMWVVDEGGGLKLPPVAGLFALTGQQFPLPVINTDDGTFTITFSGGPAWLQ
ncbi:MAG: LysM domain-containing protein, partial [Kiloniellales bacterium]